MATISVEQFVKKLENLKHDLDTGKLRSGDYDQRLARIISELRERGIEADREAISRSIEDLLGREVITPSVKTHLEKRLGLA